MGVSIDPEVARRNALTLRLKRMWADAEWVRKNRRAVATMPPAELAARIKALAARAGDVSRRHIMNRLNVRSAEALTRALRHGQIERAKIETAEVLFQTADFNCVHDSRFPLR